MPSQWWISLNSVQLPVRMEHIHAATTRWFDVGDAHWTTHKPYSISPLAERHGEYGFQLGVLVDELSDILLDRLNDDPTLRLGEHHTSVSTADMIHYESWDDLAHWHGTTQWDIALLTPTTHRSGSRNSPLPNIPAILRGLSQHWERWSDVQGVDFRDLLHDLGRTVWASDLSLSSTTVDFHRQIISGCIGELHLRCDDRELAPIADKLLRLAPYSGIGSFTLKGCGVCEVSPVNPVNAKSGRSRPTRSAPARR